MTEQIYIKRSIRWKLLTAMIGLIIVLLVTLTFIKISTQKNILEEGLERRISLMREKLIEHGKTISDNLARQTENGIASYNFSNVSEIIRKSVKDNEGMSYAILMDTSRLAYINTLMPTLEQEVLSYKEDLFASEQNKAAIKEYKDNGNSFMEFIVPISVGTGPWGVLRLGFSLDPLNKEIITSRKDISMRIRHVIIRSIITSAIFIVIGVVVVVMISTRLSKPLIGLTKSAQELAKGNFDAAENVRVDSEDEIGVLSRAFVKMSKDIHLSRLELEQRVKDRTSELRNANKKLMELDKLKTDFLNTASHELKTPIALVLGFATRIGSKFNDVILPQVKTDDDNVRKAIKQVQENVNTIAVEGKRLTALIDDYLDLSKIEAGKVEWKKELVSVIGVVEHATNTAANFFEQGEVILIKDYEDGIPKVMADEGRLMQVMINLISNAAKFTTEGSVTCKVRKAEDGVVVSVIDTGVGMSKDDQEHVFEEFKQVGSMNPNQPKGTGLGLAICKQIVERHGGKIWVESGPGKGSTISFKLPFTVGDGNVV